MTNRLPEAFESRLIDIVGASAADAVAATMAAPKRQAFWHNPLRADEHMPPGEALDALPGVSVFSGDTVLSRHPAVVSGAAYPINPASVYAALALGVRPDTEVLDLAAAPGGKALVLAGLMRNTGRLAAVEVVRGRFHRMRANFDRCGVVNAALYLADGRGVGRKVPERFDRVLLDAPCSSEARFRVDDPASTAHWSTRKIREASRKQKGLIRSAYRALKPGGELIYCTCSFAPEENEAVVTHLLKGAPDADVLPMPPAPTARAGLTAFRGRSYDARCATAVRLLPDDLWDGFFACRISKPG